MKRAIKVILLLGANLGLIFLAQNSENQKVETGQWEPQIYFAEAIQVGGVGSDIHTGHAYYIGDGTGEHDGLRNFIDEDIYTHTSFNSVFSLMYLSCADGYLATLVSDSDSRQFGVGDGPLSDDKSKSYGIPLDNSKNEIKIRCSR